MNIFEQVSMDFSSIKEVPNFDKTKIELTSFLNRDFSEIMKEDIPEDLLFEYCRSVAYARDSHNKRRAKGYFFDIGNIFLTLDTVADTKRRMFV